MFEVLALETIVFILFSIFCHPISVKLQILSSLKITIIIIIIVIIIIIIIIITTTTTTTTTTTSTTTTFAFLLFP